MKILFLSDAYMMDGSFDSYTQGMIDYLSALPQHQLLAIKTNCFFYGLSANPFDSAKLEEVRTAIQMFRPDVVFSVNRNGLAPDVVSCIGPTVPIITWFLDPYNRLPEDLMRFTERDYVHLIMVEEGFGAVKKKDFLQTYQFNPEHLTLFPFFVDSHRFYPQGLKRDTDICFVGTAFNSRLFSELLQVISLNKNNLNIFLELYLRHKKDYIFNFRDEMLKQGFDISKVDSSLAHVLQKAPLFQGIVDDQLTLEKRTRQLSMLSEFNLKVYGQPDLNWIQNMSIVNSDLLQCFQYEFVRNYGALSRIYNTSKIAFNTQYHVSRDSGFSFRVFDIMACQTLLMTEHFSVVPMERMGFRPNEDFVCYSSPEELREKCAYYLAHEDERLAITESAYRKFQQIEPQYAMKNQLANSFMSAGCPSISADLSRLTREQLLNSIGSHKNHVTILGERDNPHMIIHNSKKDQLKRTKIIRFKTKLGRDFRLQLFLERVGL